MSRSLLSSLPPHVWILLAGGAYAAYRSFKAQEALQGVPQSTAQALAMAQAAARAGGQNVVQAAVPGFFGTVGPGDPGRVPSDWAQNAAAAAGYGYGTNSGAGAGAAGYTDTSGAYQAPPVGYQAPPVGTVVPPSSGQSGGLLGGLTSIFSSGPAQPQTPAAAYPGAVNPGAYGPPAPAYASQPVSPTVALHFATPRTFLTGPLASVQLKPQMQNAVNYAAAAIPPSIPGAGLFGSLMQGAAQGLQALQSGAFNGPSAPPSGSSNANALAAAVQINAAAPAPTPKPAIGLFGTSSSALKKS